MSDGCSYRSIIRLANRIAAKNKKDLEEYIEDEIDDNESAINELLESSPDSEESEQESGPDSEEVVDNDITLGNTEFSCHIDLSLDSTFEGEVSRSKLIKTIRSQLKKKLPGIFKSISKNLDLDSINVRLNPIIIDCAVIDESERGMDEFGLTENEDLDEDDDDLDEDDEDLDEDEDLDDEDLDDEDLDDEDLDDEDLDDEDDD